MLTCLILLTLNASDNGIVVSASRAGNSDVAVEVRTIRNGFVSPLVRKADIAMPSPGSTVFVRISPDRKFICIVGDPHSNSNVALLSTDHLALLQRFTPTEKVEFPIWVNANTLQLVLRDRPTEAYFMRTDAESCVEVTKGRTRVRSNVVLHGGVAAKVVNGFRYEWPLSYHVAPEIMAKQFDNKRGAAVVATTGDSILLSVKDNNDSGGTSLLIKRKCGKWVPISVLSRNTPEFVLGKSCFMMVSRAVSKADCTVASLQDGSVLFSFAGPVLDVDIE